MDASDQFRSLRSSFLFFILALYFVQSDVMELSGSADAISEAVRAIRTTRRFSVYSRGRVVCDTGIILLRLLFVVLEAIIA